MILQKTRLLFTTGVKTKVYATASVPKTPLNPQPHRWRLGVEEEEAKAVGQRQEDREAEENRAEVSNLRAEGPEAEEGRERVSRRWAEAQGGRGEDLPKCLGRWVAILPGSGLWLKTNALWAR